MTLTSFDLIGFGLVLKGVPAELDSRLPWAKARCSNLSSNLVFRVGSANQAKLIEFFAGIVFFPGCSEGFRFVVEREIYTSGPRVIG